MVYSCLTIETQVLWRGCILCLSLGPRGWRIRRGSPVQEKYVPYQKPRSNSIIDPTLHVISRLWIGMTPSSSQEPSGSWDSIHVFESSERGRQAHYKLTSTIMLQLTTHQASEEGGENDKKATGPSAASTGNKKFRDIQPKRKGEITLSGSMTRQVRCFPAFHLESNDCGVRGHMKQCFSWS